MEKLASNHHQIVYDKTIKKSTPEILHMNALSTIFAQILALRKRMQSLEVQY